MTIYNVLLDTNVFVKSQYDFERNSLLNLRKYSEKGVVSLYTNNIIIREVKYHIEAEVGLLAQQAKNAIKKHGQLVNGITVSAYESIKQILLDAPHNLLNRFDTYMADAVVLSNENLSMIELFDDYFAHNAPFEDRQEKKSEFPDAVIIMSIKRFATSLENDVLHVVTDDRGWHNALADTENIVLHQDIKTFLTLVAKQEEELYQRIVSYIGEQVESLQDYAADWLTDQDWAFAVEEISICFECDEIDEITIADVKLVPDGVGYIDLNEGNAVVTLSGIANLKLDFSYIDHTEESYDKEDHVWYNTKYGDGLMEIEVPISCSVTTLLNGEGFDMDVPEYDQIDKSTLTIVDYELNERIDKLYGPYYDICPDCGERIGLHNDGGNGFCSRCAHKH